MSAAEQLKPAVYVIFDTETSGLLKSSLAADDKQVRVIEFAGVHMLTDGTIIKEYETFINPGIKITEEITKITGITNEQLATAPTFGDVAFEICQFMDGGDYIVAHNATFDMKLIQLEMQRLKGTIFTTFKPRQKQEIICTVEATEFMKGKRLKLVDLYTHLFGENFVGAHRAMTDVKALARIVEILVRNEVI